MPHARGKAMRIFKQAYRCKGEETRTTKNWYVEIRDHMGRAQRISGFVDKAATEELGRQLQKMAEQRCVGLPLDYAMTRWVERLPPRLRDKLARIGLLEAHRYTITRPIEELVVDFEASLAAKGCCKAQVRQVVARVRRMLAACRVRRWGDLVAHDVEVVLHGLRRRPHKPLSVQTSNHLLGSLKQFCRWVVENGLASENPLRVLHKLNVRGSTTRNRTSLTTSQLEALFVSLPAAPCWKGIAADIRATIYRVALETGLRRGEIASLTVADLNLATDCPELTVQARFAKNRREAVLPLRTETAVRLAELTRGRLPKAKVFDLQKDWRAAEMLKFDLDRAGIPSKDEQGRVLDFHALRHTFASMLARANVAPRVAQALLRHSDPRLTLGVYTHLGADEERRAVEVLPKIPTDSEDGERLRSTGTDATSFSYRNPYREWGPLGAGGVSSMPLLGPEKCTRGDSNPQPSVPKTDALSN